MKTPLLSEKIAVLVANGFSEEDLTFTQKALRDAGADLRIISMDQGLVHSWNRDGWGLNYAPDQVLSRALAVDYDMLIVPGGRRSMEKLELTAHTKRFIGGFVNSAKPVVFFEEALELLLLVDGVADMTVAGPEQLRDAAEERGFEWSDDSYAACGHVMTGMSNEETRAEFAQKAAEFLIDYAESEKSRQLEAA